MELLLTEAANGCNINTVQGIIKL